MGIIREIGRRLKAVGIILGDVPEHIGPSFFRVGWPNTVAKRLAIITQTWLLHVHSTRVHPHSLRPSYTLGLGLITLFLFIIEGVTGILLMFYYEPSTQAAYARMQDLNYTVSFGRLVRNLHRWAAELMVIAVVLHMVRVFYTGAFKPPREFNWVVGVFLLVLTLALSFTGYLLPWDQLSFWAITVGANIVSYVPFLGNKIKYLLLGGENVGGEALLRFYTLHVALLPTLAIGLIGYHLWRTRQDGGLAKPAPKRRRFAEDEEEEAYQPVAIPTFPKVVYLEGLLFLALTIALVAFSLAFNAPLDLPADPLQPDNPAKAPWYFIGLQELVSYSAFWGGFVVPAVMVVGLLLWPYIERGPRGVGVWFSKERLVHIIAWSGFMLATIAFTAIGQFFRGPNWNFYWPWQGWPGP